MGPKFHLRPARASDAAAIARVLRRSIVQVCGPHYNDDSALLGEWCKNKTESSILEWMNHSSNSMLVSEAVESGEVVGVGLIQQKNMEGRATAEILLCYVDPSWLNVGIGRELLRGMEEVLPSRTQKVFVHATLNAEAFYTKHGYLRESRPSGAPASVVMVKTTIQ